MNNPTPNDTDIIVHSSDIRLASRHYICRWLVDPKQAKIKRRLSQKQSLIQTFQRLILAQTPGIGPDKMALLTRIFLKGE